MKYERCNCQVFDSDDGGDESADGEEREKSVALDKFGNVVMSKAAVERAALKEARLAARAARTAKASGVIGRRIERASSQPGLSKKRQDGLVACVILFFRIR